MKNKLLLITLIFGSIVVFLINSNEEHKPDAKLNIQKTENKDSANLILKNTKNSNSELVSISSTKPTNSESENTTIKPKETDEYFKVSDPSKFSKQFVYSENGREFVSKPMLDVLFKMEASELFKKLSEIEYSEQAEARENQLINKLHDTYTSTPVLDEKIECAGRICVINVLYGDTNDSAPFSKVSEFDKNYSFEQYAETESGDKLFRGFYIATDDPSKLNLSFSR